MVITYFGGQFIRLSLGETVIAFNPFGKGSQFKQSRFGAALGIVSVNHPDYNGIDQLSYGEKVPFVISGPGEYEVGGIHISGFSSAKPFGQKGLLNTIYTLTLDGIRICFLGALSSSEISPETLEGIGEVDLVFVPIAGGDYLTPADAEKVAVSMDAKLIIPTMIDGPKDKNLSVFLKSTGAEGTAPVDKLTIKKKDIENFEGEVAVLLPQS
jgi:L-ascorbate metabolism protein UlaG (beta-lactamase superfamily)